ncbi:hypothetical protein KFK09_013321 [Dendrobium nobile]|uniref:Uncharacterized protein n=1 Tax=Dendrobium nobile TaxID=94219 RepID=A0A8T3B6V5_DENNO|nr:hypothetical protein KFK09_013321 [Dendrobium nobile]
MGERTASEGLEMIRVVDAWDRKEMAEGTGNREREMGLDEARLPGHAIHFEIEHHLGDAKVYSPRYAHLRITYLNRFEIRTTTSDDPNRLNKMYILNVNDVPDAMTQPFHDRTHVVFVETILDMRVFASYLNRLKIRTTTSDDQN